MLSFQYVEVEKYIRIGINKTFEDQILKFNMSVPCLQVDRKRVVDEAEGKLWADSKGFQYFETSAQTGEGVTEVFQVNIIIKIQNCQTITML